MAGPIAGGRASGNSGAVVMDGETETGQDKLCMWPAYLGILFKWLKTLWRIVVSCGVS